MNIPRYTFYKTKYGSELLIDVVSLEYVKKFLTKNAAHTVEASGTDGIELIFTGHLFLP